MMTLYLDIFSGISGDMFVGAMIDLGVDARALERELEKLKLDGWHLRVARGQKANITGVKFDVHLAREHRDEHTPADGRTHAHAHSHPLDDHEHVHEHGHAQRHDGGNDCGRHDQVHGRNFAHIKDLIQRSALSVWVKQRSLAVFQRIAVAEGKIHGLPPEEVHFHEVGAVDSIVDIVGASVALELLGKPRVLAAPVVEGSGFINCAHGRFPLPAPATLAILGTRGISVTQCDEPHELVTPTGAALLADIVESFGPMEALVAAKIGYGLGTRDHRTRPNVLRAVLGAMNDSTFNLQRSTSNVQGHDWETDTVVVVETNLDDINAEILGHFVERAFAEGALDVFHTPIQMKKNRPGILLTVLCAYAEADKFSELMLRETSAFGVRRYTTERRKLRREFATVKTAHGEVTVKIGNLDGETVQVAPEFESCRKLAAQAGVPLKVIYQAALRSMTKHE